MARVFAYLMQPDIEVTDEAIFGDVSTTIRQALAAVHEADTTPTGIAQRALDLALQELL